MKLCSSNNHYTIDCTSFGVIILFPLTSTTFFSVNIFMFLSSFHFNVFVFGDCKVHHNDWLIYETGEIDKPAGLYHNFSIPNNLTKMVHFTTQICDCDSHVPFLLDFFHLSLVFAQQWVFLCREILIIFLSVSNDFLSNSTRDVLFTVQLIDYSCADWDGLHNHFMDIP